MGQQCMLCTVIRNNLDHCCGTRTVLFLCKFSVWSLWADHETIMAWIAGYKMETLEDVPFARKMWLLSVGFMTHKPLEATICVRSWFWTCVLGDSPFVTCDLQFVRWRFRVPRGIKRKYQLCAEMLAHVDIKFNAVLEGTLWGDEHFFRWNTLSYNSMVGVSFHFTKWLPLFFKFWMCFTLANTHGGGAELI
jgi:hypothetical protein